MAPVAWIAQARQAQSASQLTAASPNTSAYKITPGYGYQPQRTALFLAGLVIYSFLLTIMLGSHGALAQTDKTATPGRRCTMRQEINVAMDLGLPTGISSSLARQHVACDIRTTLIVRLRHAP